MKDRAAHDPRRRTDHRGCGDTGSDEVGGDHRDQAGLALAQRTEDGDAGPEAIAHLHYLERAGGLRRFQPVAVHLNTCLFHSAFSCM